MAINVGLIGFGLAGRYFHAPLLRATGFNIVAVVSSRADAIREYLPEAAVLYSDDALFAREDVDVVLIATPTQLHESQVRGALQAGKHVIVDKPICVSSVDALSLAQFARERGRMLAVFQNRRWDGDFLTLQRLISEGSLGEINGYHARWDRFRPEVKATWRNEPDPASGILYDLGSHLIDQALLLFGRPDWLQADVFAQRPGARTDDGFEILLAKDAVRITLAASSLASDGGWRYRVHGSKGSYLKAGVDPQEPQARAGVEPTDPDYGVESPEFWGTLVDGATGNRQAIPTERGTWRTFYEKARSSIEQGSAPPVTAEEAAQTLEIIEAALLSSREGRRVRREADGGWRMADGTFP